MHSYGAVFAEVRIDAALNIPRLTRAVGVYSAGRIINPRTACSQMIGGIIWGLGQALLELPRWTTSSAAICPRTGRLPRAREC